MGSAGSTQSTMGVIDISVALLVWSAYNAGTPNNFFTLHECCSSWCYSLARYLMVKMNTSMDTVPVRIVIVTRFLSTVSLTRLNSQENDESLGVEVTHVEGDEMESLNKCMSW